MVLELKKALLYLEMFEVTWFMWPSRNCGVTIENWQGLNYSHRLRNRHTHCDILHFSDCSLPARDMADAETTTPQPPPNTGGEITVDDGEEEESKVIFNFSTTKGQDSIRHALFYRRLCS